MPLSPEQYAKSGTEHAHQVALFMWASMNFLAYPMLRFMFAIPNGGLRNKATAGRLKAEGVKSGVPDVMLPYPHGKYAGLFIEMKKDKGRISENQSDWMRYLTAHNYSVVTCYSWTEVRDAILNYMSVQA